MKIFTYARGLHWSLYFLLWIAGLVLVGTVLGVCGFLAGGWVLQSEKTSLALIKGGARFGSFYFLIWAPGVALCAAVMREYQRRTMASVRPSAASRAE